MRIASPCAYYDAIALQHEVSLAMAYPSGLSISCYNDELVDERQAAAILGLRASTLRRWRYSDSRTTLRRFVNAGRRRSTAEGTERCDGVA